MVIEVVVPPASRVGIALGIPDRDVDAVSRSGEITPSRRLGPRAVVVLCRQRKLQFHEQDRPFGKFIRLLEELL
jgi:hypothetical protein